MRATGIVRRIDELGRVVIPKEIRRTLRIREGDPLEIYTDHDGEVVLKKYSPIGEIASVAKDYTDALLRTLGHVAIITDRDVVVSASRYETLPGTLIEGQASGCVPVTFGNGGQADIVDHRRTGYIARYIDIVDLADGIEWATECGIDRQALHHEVRTKFSAEAVAQSYIELCRRLLRKQGNTPQPD